MGQVTSLWRYPIKSHGREQIDGVTLAAGKTIPFDRKWAVTHADSKFDVQNPAWVTCRNFMIGAATPNLAGIWAQLNDDGSIITLRHEENGEITFSPDDPTDIARFIAWLGPICHSDKRLPVGIAQVPDRGMTDTDYPSVSIMNMSSHDAVADRLDTKISPERWRGNIWLSNLDAWAEWNWIGKDIAIGGAVLHVQERVGRCMHTAANPITGQRDADMLGALRTGWGHQDFGIYARVIQGGRVAIGDEAKVI